MPEVSSVCSKCGETFTYYKKSWRGRPRKYCEPCAIERELSRGRPSKPVSEVWIQRKPPAPGTRVCARCGCDLVPFLRPPYNAKFCPPCRVENRRELGEKHRKAKRRSSRFLSREAYELRAATGCEICGSPTPRSPHDWAIDHDHDCPDCSELPPARQGCEKCVRGFLCVPCNTALGALGDNPELFQRSIRYLAAWNEKKEAGKKRNFKVPLIPPPTPGKLNRPK